MSKRFTKGDYKKRKHEVKRTSRKKTAAHLSKKSTPKGLEDIMGYGALKDLTIREVIDKHWGYWLAIENELPFKSEVRQYAKAIKRTIWRLKQPLKFSV